MLPESIYVHANLKMPSSMSSCGVVPKKSPNSHPPFSLSFSCTKTTFRPAWTHQPSGQWMVVACDLRSSILPDGHEDCDEATVMFRRVRMLLPMLSMLHPTCA